MRKLYTTLFVSSLALAIGCNESDILRRSQNRTTQAPAGPVRASTTEAGVIPAGTNFSVRTNEEIKTRQAGATFDAQVAQEIQDQNGNVLVPSGSRAELVVVESSSGGVAGTPTVELAIRSITLNGRKQQIHTANQEEKGVAGIGANRRTAEMVGGAAALGTLIGAVAGGGKGAAIGAAVGAAGGAATQVLTRGKEVQIPAETVLTFRLDQPWAIG
jgi:hypothetical protein